MSAKLWAVGSVLVFFSLIGLYVRELAVFSNTMAVKSLVMWGLALGLLLGLGILWFLRRRFQPWNQHAPEWLIIMVLCTVFSPLLLSLVNRLGGSQHDETFYFLQEEAFYASNYGILKGEKLSPTGYRLYARQKNKNYVFQYKTQAYYPLTKPGEPILLPVCKGLLGFRVVTLQ
ncbi:MAG: hypothetical protein IPL65_20575 [Lewinellaceae bacterium]|nr:hypothetical protein [Lewinellaceae bacterium]